jgi:hypothetical protein
MLIRSRLAIALLDWGGKAVAAARMVLNPCGGVPQRSSQEENVLRQRALLDERVGPKALHHLVLGEDLSAVGNQKQQRVEDFGRKGNQIAIAVQQPVGGIQAKSPELVRKIGFGCHETLGFYRNRSPNN